MTTNRNILNEADRLLVNHGVSELPLTMRKAEIIAQFSGWLLLTYDEGKELIEACARKKRQNDTRRLLWCTINRM